MDEIYHLYISLQDALYEAKQKPIDRQSLEDALEDANDRCEALINIMQKTKMTKKVRNEIYNRLGVNIPKDMTLQEAFNFINEKWS